MTRKEIYHLLPFFASVIIFTLLFSNKPFFWDKDILDSRQAHWFLANSFSLILPDELDTGHPPIVGLLLAACWYIFGKGLLISHIIMLPFSLGIIYQSYILIKKFTDRYKSIILLLLLLDTTILTQMIVVSSDLILLFFFLICLNSILSDNRIILMLGILGLSIVNMRAMVTCFGLYTFNMIINYEKGNFSILYKKSLYYIPGALLAGCFLIFHLVKKGWIGYHENSPWAGCYEKADFLNIIKNLIIFCWRFFDYGKIIYGFFFIIIIHKLLRKRFVLYQNMKSLFYLLIILIIMYLPLMVIYKNLLDHRYLIPCTYIFSFIILLYIFQYFKNKIQVAVMIGIFLITGNFIIYPDNIAQGWDATLAHIPYHKLHEKMIGYLDRNNIDIHEVGTVTPNLHPLMFSYLNSDTRSFAEKNFNTNKYILYSNIYNDFTDEDIDILKTSWIEVKKFKRMNIKLILYKNPEIKELTSI